MDFNGSLLVFVCLYAFFWILTGFYGSLLVFIAPYASLLVFMVPYRSDAFICILLVFNVSL